MKVSVVLASYNGEKFIKRLLESILQQTRLPDEIVIVDDNSTDATFQVIENFIQSNENKTRLQFRLFKNENNLGFANNFRKALSYARGDLIVLADQDDIFLTNKIEKIESHLNTNEQIKIFISAYKMIDENDKIISDSKPFKKNKIVTFHELVKGNSYPGCSLAFRSELMSTFDYFDDSIFTHDWFLLILTSIYFPSSIFFDSNSLLHYRMHGSNTLGMNFKNEIRFSLKERVEGIMKTAIFLDKMISILKEQSRYENEIDVLKKQSVFNYQRIEYLEGRETFWGLMKSYTKFKNIEMLLGDINYRIKKPE
jgi:glycosyltransferase involved in cell wall biosynthesis